MKFRRRRLHPSLLTTHRRLENQIRRDFIRCIEGRFCWNPTVVRIFNARVSQARVIEKAIAKQ